MSLADWLLLAIALCLFYGLGYLFGRARGHQIGWCRGRAEILTPRRHGR